MQSIWKRLSQGDRLLVVLVALYAALWPLEGLGSIVYALRSLLQGLIYVVAALLLVRLAYRAGRAVSRRFLWRVRHRMILAYVFVGVIPLTLALLLAAFGLLLVAGPLAAYLVSSEIDKRASALYATADSFAWELVAAEPDQRFEIGARFMDDAARRYPGLMARFETPNGPVTVPADFKADEPPAALPDYRGAVRREGQIYLAAFAQFEPGAPSLLLMAPLSRDYLLEFVPGLGIVEPLADVAERRGQVSGVFPGVRAALAARPRPPGERPLQALLPEPKHPLDWPVPWPIRTGILDWETGELREEEAFLLRTRPSAVLQLIFAPQSPTMKRIASFTGRTLTVLFLLALIVSTVIAVSLTRTVTGAVSDLYVGAKQVGRGNFAHRVPTQGYTQLTELARSFNSMTSSIEKLIEDSKEKQRLESEVAIGREVQQRLFPANAPQLETLVLTGSCTAARSVSGDFYDYLPLGPGQVAISFGDVAGKGISAALVMAAVHSILRTQLALRPVDEKSGEQDLSTARLVTEVNRQLASQTAPNQFATLFFGLFDERRGRLCYTNAGHLPPILVRNGEVHRLEVHGMVVGAFAHACYESGETDLQPGDLLVAFTDGVTEPENPYGVEYGEDRLAELLVREADGSPDEIVAAVLEDVRQWSGDPDELFDDMTLLVVRRKQA